MDSGNTEMGRRGYMQRARVRESKALRIKQIIVCKTLTPVRRAAITLQNHVNSECIRNHLNQTLTHKPIETDRNLVSDNASLNYNRT